MWEKKEQSTLWIITGLFDRVGLLINLFERGWNVACKKIRPGELFENGKNGVCVTRRSNWEGRTENILVVFQIGSISMTFGKIGWILIRWYLATQRFGAKLQPRLFLKCTMTNMENKGLQGSSKKASKQVLPCAWCVFECYSGLLVLTRSPHGSWADLLRKLQPRTHHGQHGDKYTQSIHQIGCACLNYDQEVNLSVGRFFIRCEGSLWLCIVRRRSVVDRDWAEKYPKLLHQFLTMASDQGRSLSCC